MTCDAKGCIDYQETGEGPAVVLVPGSCSTGAAWRPVLGLWEGRFRAVTTSLLGYGGSVERRRPGDCGIGREAEMLEAVIRRAGAPVHLVGHSFGALVALAVALRDRVALKSLVLMEPPGVTLLKAAGEARHYWEFRGMTADYFTAFERGDREAIATMIDFYGGAGTFAQWPEKVRAYAVATTRVNLLDWESAYGFALTPEVLTRIQVPTLVMHGGNSHPAMQRLCGVIWESLPFAALASLDGAAHFMLATHAGAVAQLVAQHVEAAEEWRHGGAGRALAGALREGVA